MLRLTKSNKIFQFAMCLRFNRKEKRSWGEARNFYTDDTIQTTNICKNEYNFF